MIWHTLHDCCTLPFSTVVRFCRTPRLKACLVIVTAMKASPFNLTINCGHATNVVEMADVWPRILRTQTVNSSIWLLPLLWSLKSSSHMKLVIELTCITSSKVSHTEVTRQLRQISWAKTAPTWFLQNLTYSSSVSEPDFFILKTRLASYPSS